MVQHTVGLHTLACTGSDYVLNGGQLRITFPANETRLKIPLSIVDDDQVESNEDLTIIFRAQANTDGLNTAFPVNPDNTTITIVDNDGKCVFQCSIVC